MLLCDPSSVASSLRSRFGGEGLRRVEALRSTSFDFSLFFRPVLLCHCKGIIVEIVGKGKKKRPKNNLMGKNTENYIEKGHKRTDSFEV